MIILENAKNYALYNRELPTWIHSELMDWAQEDFDFDCKITAATDLNFSIITKGRSISCFSWIKQDLSQLINNFKELTQYNLIRFNFNVLKSNQCSKFHVDYVRCRLITTYLGPGTEYLLDDNVNRKAFENLKESPEEANREIIINPNLIERATNNQILLMKGKHSNCLGLVHRSPPIENQKLTRIVLSLTTVDK